MPDGRRRSREGWADSMEAEPADPPMHVHRLPRGVRFALIGLCSAVLLLAVALSLTAVYVYQQQQYIQGKGEFRDREAQRIAEQNRHSWCAALDTFPEGIPSLDRLRALYHCGPGIPLQRLSPQERQQYQGTATLPPEPPSSSPSPSARPAAPSSSQSPVAPAESPATPSPTPQPPPPPSDPLLDLGGLTVPLCQSAVVCF